MDLLNLPIVKLYFTALPGDTMANGNLVVQGMQDAIHEGDRILVFRDELGWQESICHTEIVEGFHPTWIRLPLKFQSKEARVTCPDCHLTYTHEHIFSVPVKS